MVRAGSFNESDIVIFSPTPVSGRSSRRFFRAGRLCAAVLCLLLSACAEFLPFSAAPLEALANAGFFPAQSPVFVKTLLKHGEVVIAPGDVALAGPVAASANIYIEGDGAAWLFRVVPPRDPTPLRPVAAFLALADSAAVVGYVGRPCQYMPPHLLAKCSPAFWAEQRFGDDAIAMTRAAIDAVLAGLPPGSRVNLIGFSGGGTLALLVAAGRTDVNCVVTIASPLDIDAWADSNGVARLAGSRNPADPNAALSRLRQTHIYGAADRIVSTAAVGRYRNFSDDSSIKVFTGNSGHGDWENFWPDIRTSTCLNPSFPQILKVPSNSLVAAENGPGAALSGPHHD
jgi:hypothetical protein